MGAHGERNGDGFRGSQTLCTPNTADATFCLAVICGPALFIPSPCHFRASATRTHLASGLCGSAVTEKMRLGGSYSVCMVYTGTLQLRFKVALFCAA